MIDDGQKMTDQLDYAPLPQPLQERVKKTIQSL
jgi:hypothetical protein